MTSLTTSLVKDIIADDRTSIKAIIIQLNERARETEKTYKFPELEISESLRREQESYEIALRRWNFIQDESGRKFGILKMRKDAEVGGFKRRANLFKVLDDKGFEFCIRAYKIAQDEDISDNGIEEKEEVYKFAYALQHNQFCMWGSDDMEEWYNFCGRSKFTQFLGD